MEVRVCTSEVSEMSTAQDFLDLRVVDLIQSAQLVFLEPKRGRPFEMLQAVVLKRVFVGIGFILCWICIINMM